MMEKKVTCGEEGDMPGAEPEGVYFENRGRGTSQGLRQQRRAEEVKETILPFQSVGGTSPAAILIQAQGKSISDL